MGEHLDGRGGSERETPRGLVSAATVMLADLAPASVPRALMWSVYAALGVLFAVAIASHAATAFLLLAPLIFIRWSHLSLRSMRADRARLHSVARAVAHLADPIDPSEALSTFLDDVRDSFGSGTVELVVFDPPQVLRSGEERASDVRSLNLARLLVADGTVSRASASGREAHLGAALLAAGHRDALAAPLVRGGSTVGALISYDRSGFEGSDDGEETDFAALAAAATRAVEKGELLGVMVEERQRLAEIVGRSSDGILTLGLHGVIETWNPAMEAMTGVAAADIIGTPGMVQFAPRDTDGKMVRFDHWVDDGIPAELLIATTSGERWLGCSSAVGSGGDTLVVVARDITQARETDRMKDDFIATVSHELRTPLATIRGFTDVLQPPTAISDDMKAEVLARIRKGTYRLERLVANLLEVSRVDARRSVDVIPTELNLIDVVSRVVEEVNEAWPDRRIEVDTGNGGWRVHGNLLSLERILINLLSNALTYAESGAIVLKIRSEGDAGVAVSVRDHGPGIPDRDLERIFDRFERVDTETRKAGTGLGLYIARGLATSMGAALDVRSEFGHGAEFTLHLPAPASQWRPSLIDIS